MKNDYNVSNSGASHGRGRGKPSGGEIGSDSEDESNYTTSMSKSNDIATSLEKRLSNFEYLK